MAYIAKGRKYTYGVKSTLTDVSAISGASIGDTVFCSENNRLMSYNGNNIWMCNDFVEITNNSGVTLAKGDVVIINIAATNSVTRTTTQGNPLVLGPVVFGNANASLVAVAISGIYDVRTNGSTNAGDYAFTSTTTGIGDSTTTMGDGFFGVYVQQNGAAGLTKCLIRSKPEYF